MKKHVSMMALGVVATLSAASLAPNQARAQDDPADAKFATRLFGKPVGDTKAVACFARRYDAAHLARHPQQKVKEMKLLVSAEKVPEDPKPAYQFQLALQYRDQPGNFTSSGTCSHATTEIDPKGIKISCSVDCDGGGVLIALADDNKSVLLGVQSVRIWKDGAPEDDDAIALVGGEDDKEFRLQRVSLKECAPMMEEKKNVAQLTTK